MDSPAYHALVLAGCAAFWYLTYRSLKPAQVSSADIGDFNRPRRRIPPTGDGDGEKNGETSGDDVGGNVNEVQESSAAADTYKVSQLSVPREAIGAIIGKDGVNIRQLQQATRTRITFVDRPTDATEAAAGGDHQQQQQPATEIVRIRGEASCVHTAEEELRRIIASVPRKESLEFRLASRYIGPLIGRGGQQVRNLMAQSRCRIDVERGSGGASDFNEDSRQVTLRGTRDQIDLAKTLIDQLCAEIDQRDGGPRRYNGVNDRPNNNAAYPAAVTAASISPSASTSSSPSQPPQPVKQSSPPHCQPPTTVQFATFPPEAAEVPVKVCMTAVGDDPLLFYLVRDNEQGRSLGSLVSAMMAFYNQLGPDDPLSRDLRQGDFVAAYYDRESTWQRARIVNIEPDEAGVSQVDMDCLDYGDSIVVPVGRVFRLIPEFCQLPFQAIRCTLDAEVALPAGRSDECIATFQRLTKCLEFEPILARLIRFRPVDGEPVLQLLVPDPSSGKAICLTEELRRLGYLV